MPPRNLFWSFLALWIVTGLLLLVGGVQSILQTRGVSPPETPRFVLLGGFQAVAALLFLIPRTLRIGAAGLLAAITIVFVVNAGLGHFRGDLLLDGVAVLFVLIHGAPTHAKWRTAVSRPVV